MASRKIAAFVLGLLVALGAAEAGARLAIARADAPVLRWHDFSSQLKVEQMAALPKGADYVIIGTSMAQQDLVPAAIATHLGDSNIYNAALNGGVPVVMEPWLIDEVLPATKPSTVVWGLSPLDLSAVYGDATKNAYDQAFETKSGLLAEADRFVSKHSTLVSSRAVLRSPIDLVGDGALRRLAQADEAAKALGDSGQRTVFESVLSTDRQNEVSERVSPFRLDRHDMAAIARTVADLKAQGIQVLFVELPVPPRLISLMPNKNEDQQLFSNAVAALGAEMEVEVFVATDAYDDSHFVDFTHMSAEAAAQFSDDIGRQLAAR